MSYKLNSVSWKNVYLGSGVKLNTIYTAEKGVLECSRIWNVPEYGTIQYWHIGQCPVDPAMEIHDERMLNENGTV